MEGFILIAHIILHFLFAMILSLSQFDLLSCELNCGYYLVTSLRVAFLSVTILLVCS